MVESITDKFGRPIRDLRISVTDRCNFRCSYCMPKEIFGDDFEFMKKDELLSFEELERIAKIYASLGVKKLRITGGEPLLRKDLHELIARLNQIEGIEDIGMTTNGLLLKKHGKKLYDAGLRRLNISLDAMDDELFGQINDRGIGTSRIIEQIEYAISLGFEIKINMVVQKGLNEHEILPMARFFKTMPVTLRFIEFMDVGNDNGWNFDKVITKKEILAMLEDEFDIEPLNPAYYGEVAKVYRHKDAESYLGFITSVSESFCSTCTRARLSSDGKFYGCLFAVEGFDIKQIMREGISDDELVEVLTGVWNKRDDRYSDLRTEITAENRRKRNKINMSYIGG
ncbi:GTP 3',8-cyclase MoaA [Salinicoccus roseus]|uniref:GTP 3',8-cyclase n=1 Tax=Salinicoccus roseus TaxID=45670 RepID=A0A0C2DNV0_9STAP|nr:GTP 3',8-cyclase MoaA [Salinicoccus roseus]KIH71683.1 molybdenum cofactor biosynthesis protein A [Salinicoccus roseus]MDB0579784.1 GTP 3',8-cyclase MoaA [Salinicoccus roseus]OZT77209.1 GTP 3',8-cyclase MoaA [Salinicoccus roseus]RPE55079.1 cyclic pyranopterin monophosphate synthase subunit MoaA [Salinicoccus roseus]GGA60243.1 GTP 3',8-cyclase [Salinicoccus roseus]